MIRRCLGETYGFVTLNDPIALYQASRDPALFFQGHPLPLVNDEVQYALELVRFMKLLVDASDERGRVVLTGSQGYRLMHGVSESLAGCEGIPDLSGISLREELGMCGGGAYIPGASELAEAAALKGVWVGDGAVVCRAPGVFTMGERVKAVPIWAL